MGGGAVAYPHSVLHFPSFSAVTRPKLGIPIFSLKEIADRHFVSSIKADGSQRRRSSNNPSFRRTAKEEGGELISQSFDGRSSSSSKEEILALFKRIQSSVSKGDSSSSKNRNSKPSADALMEVLRQSRTRGKGKVVGKKEEKLNTPRNDSPEKEDITELPAVSNPKTTRPPSSFTRRSPIVAPSSSRDKVQLRNEEEKSEKQSKKLEDMKLAELKQVAKSKGIRGYSKLKKSELLELLTSS